MATHNAWRNPRPLLHVEQGSSGCYAITSTRELSLLDLAALRGIGLIGYGQEHSFLHVTKDGKRLPVTANAEPTGIDMVACIEFDRATGKTVRANAINPYTGEPYPPHEGPYWTYECHDRVDSSG